jgi:hypothetical protein
MSFPFRIALSQAVQDVPYEPAAQHACMLVYSRTIFLFELLKFIDRQVEQKAATRNNYLDVRFGRTEPLPPG